MSTLTNLHSLAAVPPPTTVADALAMSLADWDVGAVYGVSGANIEHLHDAIYRHGGDRLRSVAARSESGAAFMADAHARVHSSLGVCCSTSGGGMMNLAVGIAESYQEGIPVLAIVGQIPRAFEGIGGFQDSSGIGQTVDAEGMWRAIAKEVRVVRDGATLWEDLLAATRAALQGRKGPAVLLIPRDVFDEPVPDKPVDWPSSLELLDCPSPVETGGLDDLRAHLARAERPVIVAGAGVRHSSAPYALTSFARRARIPVVTTLADISAFPNDDPLYLGTVGTAGHPSAHRHLNEDADLIIVVGSRLELMLRAPIREALSRCPVVFIDTETELVRRTDPDASTIDGDIGEVFQTLMQERHLLPTGPGRPEDYRLERFLPRLADPVDETPDDAPLPPDALLQSEAIMMMESALPTRGQLLFDAGNCAASALHYLSIPKGLSTTIALGMGGMGYAIPAAVGAQLKARAGSRTVVLCGDGAFLLLGMEVHTAVDLGLPILFVVFNNGGHGMCVTRQQLFFEGRIECSQYTGASIAQIARGFGHESQLWVGSADTVTGLENALASLDRWDWQGPAVLELVLRHEEVPPFTPFLDADAPVGDPHHLLSERKKAARAFAA